MEGVYYKYIQKRVEKKDKQYSELPIQTVEEVYSVVEINIPSVYKFNENTEILIIDCEKETQCKTTLTKEQIRSINKVSVISQGVELFHMLNQSSLHSRSSRSSEHSSRSSKNSISIE